MIRFASSGVSAELSETKGPSAVCPHGEEKPSIAGLTVGGRLVTDASQHLARRSPGNQLLRAFKRIISRAFVGDGCSLEIGV